MFVFSNCDVCGKRRGRGSNHSKCSIVRRERNERIKKAQDESKENDVVSKIIDNIAGGEK